MQKLTQPTQQISDIQGDVSRAIRALERDGSPQSEYALRFLERARDGLDELTVPPVPSASFPRQLREKLERLPDPWWTANTRFDSPGTRDHFIAKTEEVVRLFLVKPEVRLTEIKPIYLDSSEHRYDCREGTLTPVLRLLRKTTILQNLPRAPGVGAGSSGIYGLGPLGKELLNSLQPAT